QRPHRRFDVRRRAQDGARERRARDLSLRPARRGHRLPGHRGGGGERAGDRDRARARGGGGGAPRAGARGPGAPRAGSRAAVGRAWRGGGECARARWGGGGWAGVVWCCGGGTGLGGLLVLLAARSWRRVGGRPRRERAGCAAGLSAATASVMSAAWRGTTRRSG